MMNGFQNPYMNPYLMQPQIQQPSVQVTKVNGENGARAYQIGANSSALLLDESGLMVWLVTSDGAGYKTVSAYDITPHQNAPVPDYSGLEERIKRLEMMVNGTPRNPSADRTEQSYVRADKADDRNGERIVKPTSHDEPVAYKQSEYETGSGFNQSFKR